MIVTVPIILSTHATMTLSSIDPVLVSTSLFYKAVAMEQERFDNLQFIQYKYKK